MPKKIHTLKGFFNYLNKMRLSPHLSYEPFIFQTKPEEEEAFEMICGNSDLTIIDYIDRQLEELVRIQNPAQTDKAKRMEVVEKMLDDEEELAASTNWVYFPWNYSVVRILNENDYFEVITNRNKFKITATEQETLRDKTIGIIGLSVGGEAAVSVAQEHLCGTIKIADYDKLDLSNLNRLNAGVNEIGLLKTTICARRIYRLNPYLTVIPFEKGIMENNMGEFLEGLDLLIEECDGLEIKIPIRKQAKALKINTIYCADERGLLSVEPYGNDPNFPIFHGFLSESQPARATFKDDAEFLKALAVWCGGWDVISERSRQSLAAIGKTTCGYPQLASEARFAAGQLGNIARRLLLGEQIPAFFKHIDLEEIVR